MSHAFFQAAGIRTEYLEKVLGFYRDFCYLLKINAEYLFKIVFQAKLN
jgi:hypothetical protein